MKKIIVLIILGVFAFSLTSLKASTPFMFYEYTEEYYLFVADDMKSEYIHPTFTHPNQLIDLETAGFEHGYAIKWTYAPTSGPDAGLTFITYYVVINPNLNANTSITFLEYPKAYYLFVDDDMKSDYIDPTFAHPNQIIDLETAGFEHGHAIKWVYEPTSGPDVGLTFITYYVVINPNMPIPIVPDFRVEVTNEPPFDMYDPSGTTYQWVLITYDFEYGTLALDFDIPSDIVVFLGEQVVPGGTLYSRAYLKNDSQIVATAEYNVIEPILEADSIRLELSNLFDTSPEGLIANSIEFYLLYNTSSTSLQPDEISGLFYKGIEFNVTLLEGQVYFYDGLRLHYQTTFKGMLNDFPPYVPIHPKGYDFYRWVTFEGIPIYANEYILETHLSNDGNLRLYAQFTTPSTDGDITSPDLDEESSIIHFLSAFGLDNTSGFVLLYVVISMILLFIIVLLKLGSTVAGISQIGLSVLFWILGMLPIWVMLIISILAIYLLIMKQDTIGGGVDG